MTNADYASSRLPVPMVAIFGSALRDPTTARDLDVVYGGMTPEQAIQQVRTARPDLAHLPIDLHEGQWSPPWFTSDGHMERAGRYADLQAVDYADPVFAIVGPAPDVQVNISSLPGAVRFFARHGRLPVDYLWTSYRLGMTADEAAASYFGGGLTALRTAVGKLDAVQRERLNALLGPVFDLVVERDLTPGELAIIRPGSPGFGGVAEIMFVVPPTGAGFARTGYDMRRLDVAQGRLIDAGRCL